MTGTELIEAERQRQIKKEGWTPEHDDKHTDGSLAMAAVCFAMPRRVYEPQELAKGMIYADPWPESWARRWDRRFLYGERRTNPGNVPPNPGTYSHAERLELLIKAGALIAAEIDRLHRTKR